MELLKTEAYAILDLQTDASFSSIVQRYKHQALEWYPDKHARSTTSLNKFQLISQAFLVLCSTDEPCKRKLLTFEEMLSLFQFIFFRNENIEEVDDADLSDSNEEGNFEEFCVDWELDDVDLVNEKLDNLMIQDTAAACNDIKDKENENLSDKEDKAVRNAQELIQEEEREKKKAMKRKAQKKRRKEKKKQEKRDEKKQTEENANGDHTDTSRNEDSSRAQGASSSESEEDIDPESAFVATVAKKTNQHIPPKKESDTTTQAKAEDQGTIVLRSRQLALRGNVLATSGYYRKASKLFTEAIKLNVADHRYYGNRSYCHDVLGNYDRALKDADKSISLAPEFPKGYFRKGKALSSMKRFVEAENCFKEVLKIDPACGYAEKELSEVQILRIMEMGFEREEAINALSTSESVEDALELLLPHAAAAAVPARRNDDVFNSDEEDELLIASASATGFKPVSSQVVDVKLDPKNPEGHNSIWVGNLQSATTEKIIHSLFCKYGEIISIKFSPEKFYAFVNYKNKESAGNAMRALQGADLFGSNILIRYPNTKTPVSASQDSTKAKVFVAPVNGDECYFWRTQGCIHGDKCRFRHVREHKGIDNSKKAPQKY